MYSPAAVKGLIVIDTAVPYLRKLSFCHINLLLTTLILFHFFMESKSNFFLIRFLKVFFLTVNIMKVIHDYT